MEYLTLNRESRPLADSELRTFPIAYGCWRFAGTGVSEARAKVEAALDCGMNLFDHADIYGDGAAEDLFGRVLAESPSMRDRMLIATKGGIVKGLPYDSSKEHLIMAAEASLRRLRIDVIDLYQIHRPDLLAHPEEVAEAFVILRESGKIREAGVSNYWTSQVDSLQAFLPFDLVSNQVEISAWELSCFRDGTLDQCITRGMTPLAWSPMAKGLIGAEPQETDSPESSRLVDLLHVMDSLAEREGVNRCAVALAFLLVHPAGIVPIIGTQRIERIRASIDAFRVKLTRRDWYAIFAASQGAAMP